MSTPFVLPADVPDSLWLFVVVLIVYLLQRLPWTGIYLMLLGAPLWSAVLINLAMIGVIWEVLAGASEPVWLMMPALYFCGYYILYVSERRFAAALIAETAAHNAAQHLPFVGGVQDLLFGPDWRHDADFFLSNYPVDRVFNSDGQVKMLADAEACALVRGNKVFESAASRVSPNHMIKNTLSSDDIGVVSMPGRPDRPVVEVHSNERQQRRGTLRVSLVETQIIDMAARRMVVVHSGTIGQLKPFPLWVMGYAIGGGGTKWEGVHGFMRNQLSLIRDMNPNEGPSAVIAAALRLKADNDRTGRAVDAAFLQPMIEQKERKVAAKEVDLVQKILVDPGQAFKNA